MTTEFSSTAADNSAAWVPARILLYRKVMAGEAAAAQLWFDQSVLDQYRGRPGWRVIRTDTVGRVRSPDGWSLDFGIADGDQLVHTSVTDVVERLPAPERVHWLEHLRTLPVSANFIVMRSGAGACISD